MYEIMFGLRFFILFALLAIVCLAGLLWMDERVRWNGFTLQRVLAGLLLMCGFLIGVGDAIYSVWQLFAK